MFNLIITIIFIIASSIIIYLLVKEREIIVFAWKNLYRNLRRTSLTLIAIILATTAIIVVETYILNKYHGLRETTIRSQLGHLQIQKVDFNTKGRGLPTEYIIEDYEKIIQQIKNDPQLKHLVRKITTEVNFNGLVMGEEQNSINFIGRGVDPDKEVFFSSQDIYEAGKELSRKDEFGAVLGAGIAEQLGVKVGNSITLLSQTATGGIDILDANVRGIFRPLSSEYNAVIIKTPIEFSKSLLDIQGVNKILILLHETEKTDIVAKRIKEIIISQRNDLVVFTWLELSDFYNSVVTLFGNFFSFFKVIISVVIFFLIMNTMTMSIFERFHEIGTLRAIGFTRFKIVNLFACEAFILALIGSIIGVGVGLGITNFINSLFIMEAPPPGMAIETPLALAFLGNYSMLINAALLLIVISWISSLYPSIKAAKSKIVECLAHT